MLISFRLTTLARFLLRGGKWIGAQPWRSVGADENDYEMHLGTKLDYMMYFNTKQLRYSEMTLLRNHCKLERTQMLTILMLAIQITRLAGFMLTGNRSSFLDTDGSVAWLDPWLKFLSPLRVLDEGCDRIPILFERTTNFLDPITRQTYDLASRIPCLGDYTNVCQLDLENDNSWYQLLPGPMLLISLRCSSQLNLDTLLSFLLSILGVLECILSSN